MTDAERENPEAKARRQIDDLRSALEQIEEILGDLGAAT